MVVERRAGDRGMNEEDAGKKPGKLNRGQFKNGVSGNPRGRPRKAVRTYTHRQIRHDILDLMEEKIELRIQGRVQRIPIIQGIYWKMFQTALEGDQKMMLAVAQLRHDLVHEHKLQNHDLVSELDSYEHDLRERGVPEGQITAFLNELRAKTKLV
jgi:hypothetical protein